MTHVDDFIDQLEPSSANELYARWFFLLFRFPAMTKAQFRTFLEPYKLFCEYGGRRYRVTGCSRMGDVWLSADFKRDCGYELRVDVADCSAWGNEQ